MKKLHTSIVLLLAIYCNAQKDSSIYYHFKNNDAFPNVTDVYYESLTYNNQQTKCEGWIVEERAGDGATILKINGADSDLNEKNKFGVWKYYYRNGDIKAIDTIHFDENGKRFGSQNFYSHNGNLFKRFELTVKQCADFPKLGTASGMEYSSSLYAKETMFLYNKQGRVIRKTVWEEGEIKEDLAFEYLK